GTTVPSALRVMSMSPLAIVAAPTGCGPAAWKRPRPPAALRGATEAVPPAAVDDAGGGLRCGLSHQCHPAQISRTSTASATTRSIQRRRGGSGGGLRGGGLEVAINSPVRSRRRQRFAPFAFESGTP